MEASKALKWHITDDEKVVLLIVVNDKDYEVEIPADMLQAMILELPPSEEKRIRSLLTLIYEKRKERILGFNDLIAKSVELEKDAKDIATKILGTSIKIEIFKFKTVLETLSRRTRAIQQERYLIKALDIEEARLRADLARILHGRE